MKYMTMSLTRNIILLLLFSVTNNWAHSPVDLESKDLNESDNGVKLLDNNDVYLNFFKNKPCGSEKVRIQLYYECLCPHCRRFDIDQFVPVVETMSPYLDIQTYPFGNAKIIYDHGRLDFISQHGPAESYGNQLHACALDKLQHSTALLYNICLMNSTDGLGSDDRNADRCGRLMNINSEPIKQCAKGTRGTQLLQYFGQESKTANFSHVPYILINGKVVQSDNFRNAVYDALVNPPLPYQ